MIWLSLEYRRGVFQSLFTDSPVGNVSLDESRDGNKQQHQDVHRREDLVYRRRLLHSKGQDTCPGINIKLNEFYDSVLSSLTKMTPVVL